MSDTGQHPTAGTMPQSIFPTLERIEKKLDDLRDGHGDMNARLAVLEASDRVSATTVSELLNRIRKLEDTRAQLMVLAAVGASVGTWLLSKLH